MGLSVAVGLSVTCSVHGWASPAAALCGGNAVNAVGHARRLACSPPLRRVGLVAVRMSSPPTGDGRGGDPSGKPDGMSLSAYDQLVLSVRALKTLEIKQELVTRGVGFADCFEKEELVARLVEARLQLAAEAFGEGAVSPEGQVVDEAIEVAEEEVEATEEYDSSQIKQDSRIFDEELKQKLSQKEKVEKMLQDQELMAALRNPEVMAMAQQVLKDPSSADSFKNDPEVSKAIEKVQQFLRENA